MLVDERRYEAHTLGWPEPYIYIYTVLLAGKPLNIRSYTMHMYGYSQF